MKSLLFFVVFFIHSLTTWTYAQTEFTTAHDTIPNYATTPTIVSVATGNWSSTSSWDLGRVPNSTDVVKIVHTITYDSTTANPNVIGIATSGKLQFSTSQSTILTVGTMIIWGTGELEIGTAGSPLSSSYTAEIIIKNTAIDTGYDPSQYGIGIVVVETGKIRMHGAAKTPTFVRFATEPAATNTSLTVASSVTGWAAGDRVIIPDSRHIRQSDHTAYKILTPQYEERVINTASGTTVTITAGLTYDHYGARDRAGTLLYLPHIMNLTRNIIIRSAIANATAGTHGHIFFTSRADIDIRYVLFKDLGRTKFTPLDNTVGAHIGTNQIGRYPIHFHHCYGPSSPQGNGYQFTLIGNAFDGGTAIHDKKWQIAIHDSHYGLIQDNVVYNAMGAGVVAEDASETGNVFDHNMVIRVDGSGNRGDGRGFEDLGHDGVGFWFRGVNNIVKNNVAANAYGITDTTNGPNSHYGFKHFQMYAQYVRIPNAQGNDTSVEGQYTLTWSHGLPLAEWQDNEVYTSESGLTYWWIGTLGSCCPTPDAPESIFNDFVVWHVFLNGVFHYEAKHTTIDGMTVIGFDPDVNSTPTTGIVMGDYYANNILYKNLNFQGLILGIAVSTDTEAGAGITVQDSYFSNADNIHIQTLWSSAGDPSYLDPRTVTLRNLTFDQWTGSTSTYKTINRIWQFQASVNTTQTDTTLVYDYQGNPSADFQVYYHEQIAQNVAGGLAPCSDESTYPDVTGVTCPLNTTGPSSLLMHGVRLGKLFDDFTHWRGVHTLLREGM